MKTVIRLAALLPLGLFIAACIGPAEEEVGEAQEPLPSTFTITTYYKESAKINVVGTCVSPSICSGGSTQCTGQKTSWYDRETETCP
jgi:hypothetical protein